MEVWLLVINKGFSVEMGLSGYNTEKRSKKDCV